MVVAIQGEALSASTSVDSTPAARERSTFMRGRQTAARWTGFFQLVGHGIDDNRGMLSASFRLFAFPEKDKLARSFCLGAHPRLLVAHLSSVSWTGLAAVSGSLITAGRARAAQ
jgi:isopenicillin N synthase-like dioxygenase